MRCAILHPLSSTLHPPSSILHPPSSILHPPSSILHPPSSILHPLSSILYRLMARCDQGYLCDVCGEEVAEIVDSDLYLTFILGRVEARALLARPERHIRCNPVQAQFIVDERFPPMNAEGAFDKRQ